MFLDAAAATALCTLNSPEIRESSGLATSSVDRSVVFTHNDSGDRPRFFAVDTNGCHVQATYRVTHATAKDWEDMARDHGFLYFADIGSNAGTRTSVVIYRVREPRQPFRSGSVAATAFTLRYPDSGHNAESLLVDPRSGRVSIATKAGSGSTIYSAPLPLRSGTLHEEATVPVAYATGGAWSSDGRTVALRTTTTAYLWDRQGGIASTFAGRPRTLDLPTQKQGESVTFARGDDALLLSSEARRQPIWSVPLH